MWVGGLPSPAGCFGSFDKEVSMNLLVNNAVVRGNKFWNSDKGEGRVVEVLRGRNQAVVAWENCPARESREWLIDLEPVREKN